jgi:peptidyl-tRNA hydrolase, PTH1 family
VNLGRGRGQRPERRGTPADHLVIGLGNPGKEYARSRHNVGFEVIDLLAERARASLKAGKERALVTEVTIAGQRIALACPTTFMNLSGESAVRLVRRYGIEDAGQIIVVHDELDLPPGTVKVKVGGGLAGHNGLRSITQHLNTQDYVRVRIGVGKPPSKEAGAGHVLNKVPKAERELLDECVVRAADAVEVIIGDGADAAMQRTNTSA